MNTRAPQTISDHIAHTYRTLRVVADSAADRWLPQRLRRTSWCAPWVGAVSPTTRARPERPAVVDAIVEETRSDGTNFVDTRRGEARLVMFGASPGTAKITIRATTTSRTRLRYRAVPRYVDGDDVIGTLEPGQVARVVLSFPDNHSGRHGRADWELELGTDSKPAIHRVELHCVGVGDLKDSISAIGRVVIPLAGNGFGAARMRQFITGSGPTGPYEPTTTSTIEKATSILTHRFGFDPAHVAPHTPNATIRIPYQQYDANSRLSGDLARSRTTRKAIHRWLSDDLRHTPCRGGTHRVQLHVSADYGVMGIGLGQADIEGTIAFDVKDHPVLPCRVFTVRDSSLVVTDEWDYNYFNWGPIAPIGPMWAARIQSAAYRDHRTAGAVSWVEAQVSLPKGQRYFCW